VSTPNPTATFSTVKMKMPLPLLGHHGWLRHRRAANSTLPSSISSTPILSLFIFPARHCFTLIFSSLPLRYLYNSGLRSRHDGVFKQLTSSAWKASCRIPILLVLVCPPCSHSHLSSPCSLVPPSPTHSDVASLPPASSLQTSIPTFTR
jgi:hypothetical protein